MSNTMLSTSIPMAKIETANHANVQWINILKCVGIFTIYLGHYGDSAGYFYHFVFSFHVPLFFFISGYLENFNKNGFTKTIFKKIQTILIPFYFFGLFSIIIFSINGNYNQHFILQLIIGLAQGSIRNQYFAGSLWFLTSLFCIILIFQIIKLVKYKSLILIISFILYFTAQNLLPNNPLISPSWCYNLDSALVYLIFYTFGYLIFPYINKMLNLNNFIKKILFVCLFVVTFIYTVEMYFGNDLFNLIPYMQNQYVSQITFIISTLIIILFWIFVSYMLQDAKLLGEIGMNTLYLCGNENVIKLLIPTLLSMFGLNLTISTPLMACIMSMLLLLIVYKFIVPFQKCILNGINNHLKFPK